MWAVGKRFGSQLLGVGNFGPLFCFFRLGMIFVRLVGGGIGTRHKEEGGDGEGEIDEEQLDIPQHYHRRPFVRSRGGRGEIEPCVAHCKPHTTHRQHQFYPMVQSITNQRQCV